MPFPSLRSFSFASAQMEPLPGSVYCLEVSPLSNLFFQLSWSFRDPFLLFPSEEQFRQAKFADGGEGGRDGEREWERAKGREREKKRDKGKRERKRGEKNVEGRGGRERGRGRGTEMEKERDIERGIVRPKGI